MDKEKHLRILGFKLPRLRRKPKIDPAISKELDVRLQGYLTEEELQRQHDNEEKLARKRAYWNSLPPRMRRKVLDYHAQKEGKHG